MSDVASDPAILAVDNDIAAASFANRLSGWIERADHQGSVRSRKSARDVVRQCADEPGVSDSDDRALGHRLIKAHPESERSEFDAGEEVFGRFIVSRGHGAVMFDFVEEALDRVSVSVKGQVSGCQGNWEV